MASRNTGLETTDYNYASAHIGGNTIKDKKQEYVKQQLEILDNFGKKVPQSYEPNYDKLYTTTSGFMGGQMVQRYPDLSKIAGGKGKEEQSDKYDPYGDFLYKQGLLNRESSTRYKTEYINIDSSLRTKVPSNLIEKSYIVKNGLVFMHSNTYPDELKIKISNHNFEVNDKITLYGLTYTQKKLKLIVNSQIILEFKEGSEYLGIYDTIPYIDKSTNIINYDSSDMNIILDGIKGYPNTTYIGNIPITTLNRRHRIYLTHPETPSVYTPNKYYIKLVKKYSGTYNPTAYNITITYLFIAGIPNNLINADYPINFERSQGYHIIHKIDKNNIYIKLEKKSFLGELVENIGEEITIEKIKTIINGYPNPNNYVVNLGRNFANVISIRMISSLFPNTEKNVRNTPVSRKNNRLYWQNLDDGEYIYYIELPSGNYTRDGLKTAIEKSVSEVKRINMIETTSNTSYSNNNYITLNIDRETDIVTFSSYKVAKLIKPLTDIDPEISLTNIESTVSLFYDITVEHQNHGAVVGDTITISGAIEHYGIPESVLNTNHTIIQVIDNNRYQIRVSNFNLGTTRTNSGGGSAITVIVPNIFRLRFDYADTMGKLLGFRDVGSETSITQYNTSIKNSDLYLNEQTIDEAGRNIIITNNSISLTGTNYIIGVCKQIKGLYNEGKIKDGFTKILMTGEYGTVQKDSFIQTIIYYHDPLVELGELEFEFYTADGELYEFYGIDHSFVLEIVTIAELPKGTSITTNLGKII